MKRSEIWWTPSRSRFQCLRHLQIEVPKLARAYDVTPATTKSRYSKPIAIPMLRAAPRLMGPMAYRVRWSQLVPYRNFATAMTPGRETRMNQLSSLYL
jgi:hypothetical protein